MILCEAKPDGYFIDYKPVTPTGRWRIRTHPNMDAPIMDIEVAGRWWNRWISESQLAFREHKESCVIFDCKEAGK